MNYDEYLHQYVVYTYQEIDRFKCLEYDQYQEENDMDWIGGDLCQAEDTYHYVRFDKEEQKNSFRLLIFGFS